MKKPRIAFTPADNNNLPLFNNLEKSLRKFHTEEELPLIRYDNRPTVKDFFYKATPLIARELIDEYETVIKLDADQIILGPLNELWEGEDWDVKTVLNDPTYPIMTWDIQPYFNMGLVVMRSKEFIEHWYRLCMSEHFSRYQFREQDLFNILCSDYLNYKIVCLDTGDKFYGEFAKSAWPQFHMEGDKVMAEGKELRVVHFGGGNDPGKGNFRTRFQEDVVKRIEVLIK